MELAVKREVQIIEPAWSMPHFLEKVLLALKDGAALSTAGLDVDQVDPKVALIVKTSGSTGNPKSVLLTSQSLIASARASHQYLSASPGQRWSLLLPTTHIAGINVLVRSIELGTVPVGVDSQAEFSAIVPTQLHRAVHSDRQLSEHLQNCRAVLVGGARLDSELKKRAQDLGINVITTYGMSETSGGVIYDGKALDGVSFQIIDKHIALKGPQIAYGYLEGGFPIKDGWFITSDLGFIQDGALVVEARADDQIISGGENISLVLVEQKVREILPNQEIILFSLPDDLWGEKLCIGSDSKIDLMNLKEKMGSILTPKSVFLFDQIPTTSIGKPDRRAAAELARKIGAFNE
jgi:O-succinylbenzoic acid--CoA ligase